MLKPISCLIAAALSSSRAARSLFCDEQRIARREALFVPLPLSRDEEQATQLYESLSHTHNAMYCAR